MNPMTLIQTMRGSGNPQQFMLTMLEQQMGGTPMGQNLLQLAKGNQTEQIEQIARNMFAQNGRDFDSEFKTFKDTFGL